MLLGKGIESVNILLGTGVPFMRIFSGLSALANAGLWGDVSAGVQPSQGAECLGSQLLLLGLHRPVASLSPLAM